MQHGLSMLTLFSIDSEVIRLHQQFIEQTKFWCLTSYKVKTIVLRRLNCMQFLVRLFPPPSLGHLSLRTPSTSLDPPAFGFWLQSLGPSPSDVPPCHLSPPPSLAPSVFWPHLTLSTPFASQPHHILALRLLPYFCLSAPPPSLYQDPWKDKRIYW